MSAYRPADHSDDDATPDLGLAVASVGVAVLCAAVVVAYLLLGGMR